MIKLNEIIFSKKEIKHTTRQVVVNMNHVEYIYPTVVSWSAPRKIDSIIYGENIPRKYYIPLDKVECTTLCFGSKSEIDVIETIDEILQLMKED